MSEMFKDRRRSPLKNVSKISSHHLDFEEELSDDSRDLGSNYIRHNLNTKMMLEESPPEKER